MIKCDLAGKESCLEITGPAPLVYMEAGKILRSLHQHYLEKGGKECADGLIKQLCEDVMLITEEMEKQLAEKEKANPVLAALTDAVFAELFGGGQEDD